MPQHSARQSGTWGHAAAGRMASLTDTPPPRWPLRAAARRYTASYFASHSGRPYRCSAAACPHCAGPCGPWRGVARPPPGTNTTAPGPAARPDTRRRGEGLEALPLSTLLLTFPPTHTSFPPLPDLSARPSHSPSCPRSSRCSGTGLAEQGGGVVASV